MALEIHIVDSNKERIGTLCAFSEMILSSPFLINNIYSWRKRYREFFFTQFEETPEKARGYVEAVLADSTRRMFFIYEDDYFPVGHIGAMHLDRSTVDLDNMIRGVAPVHPHIMYWAEIALLRWIFSTYPATKAQCILLGDNERTVRHHERCGFRTVAKLPLTRWESDGVVHIQPYTDGMISGELIADGMAQMELTAEEFWDTHGGKP